MMSSRFDVARRKYKPAEIRYLLVAESPPTAESNRFFYFEKVPRHDSLFIETMKVLYGTHLKAQDIRPRKPEFLQLFSQDGFYLVDSTKRPLGRISDSRKRKIIRDGLPALKGRLRRLVEDEVPVVLISKNVFETCAGPLRKARFNVVNDAMIDFPSSNG